MAGEEYGDPRLAAIYDLLYPDRRDLDAYIGVVREFDARRVLDIGCGTGSFALLLAGLGIEVTGLDPAQASLDVARAKPDSDRVRWVCGDATALPPLQVDVATMTANVAPGIADTHAWQKTLRFTYKALRPGGRLVFETRNPAKRVWESWTRDESYRVTEIPGAGSVETWVDVIDVSGPLVAIRRTYVFAPDNDVLTSTSTLRFPEQEEVEAELTGQGYVVSEVRDAPDRPGREFVFIALRPE